MRTRLVLLLNAAAILSAGAAYAHHSFAATYDESKSISIKGRMVQFQFRNPHSFVAVEVTTGTETVRWSVEWAGTTQLNNTGVQNDTLKYGDTVEITGNPGREASDHRIRMRTVKRLDGTFTWGTRPGEVIDPGEK
jgi:lysyl-tRNA synthetase class II